MASSMPSLETQRQALLNRARQLGGRTLAELAAPLHLDVPEDLKRHKGFVGQLLERALGLEVNSTPGPDVPALGLEIKTLPIDRRGRPLESTFVCTIRLEDAAEAQWDSSSLRHKLGCVMWIPVLGERQIRVPERRVGSAFLWTPSADQWRQLEADWTELFGTLGRAGPEGLTAHVGHWLQVRPKAAHSGVRTRGRDPDMAPVRVPPRGFYLRARFTQQLLSEAFG